MRWALIEACWMVIITLPECMSIPYCECGNVRDDLVFLASAVFLCFSL